MTIMIAMGGRRRRELEAQQLEGKQEMGEITKVIILDEHKSPGPTSCNQQYDGNTTCADSSKMSADKKSGLLHQYDMYQVTQHPRWTLYAHAGCR